jgi:hypothetical protein
MKLNSVQIERTLGQIKAEAIPADHPLIPQLTQLFGDHTYFLDNSGLNIVEPAEPSPQGDQLGVVVNLAEWTGSKTGSKTARLEPHAPERTDLLVALGTNSGQ